MDFLKNLIIDMISGRIGSMNTMVTDITSLVSQSPRGFSESIYRTVEAIANAIIPIAIVLAVLFFVIELCNKTIMMEMVTWESIAKLLLKLILAKVLIQSSFWLLESTFAYIVDIASVVGNVTAQIPELDMSIIESEINQLNVISLIGYWAALLPLNLILWIITWMVQIIAYGRMIELYVLFAISPLPLATLASEGVHDIAKKFLQSFVAVSLQGVIIMIAVGVFGGFIGTVGDFDIAGAKDVLALLGGYILMGSILALILFKSGSWAKQVVGLM